jgi:hypothetical protein
VEELMPLIDDSAAARGKKGGEATWRNKRKEE